MKNEQLYNKTVDILVQAYFNDTLISGNCYACACGNLVAANMGFEYEEVSSIFPQQRLKWKGFTSLVEETRTFNTFTWFWVKYPNISELTPEIEQQINSTGYSSRELARIETAFEDSYEGNDPMFNALMAVVDVLDEIHENKEETVTHIAKSKFVKV